MLQEFSGLNSYRYNFTGSKLQRSFLRLKSVAEIIFLAQIYPSFVWDHFSSSNLPQRLFFELIFVIKIIFLSYECDEKEENWAPIDKNLWANRIAQSDPVERKIL